MKIAGIFGVLYLTIQACPAFGNYIGNKDAIVLKSEHVSYTKDAQSDTIEVTGVVKIENNSAYSICIMKDVESNINSPYIRIEKSINNAKFSEENGISYPPKTNEIRKIEEGGQVQGRRILNYISKGKRKSKVATTWACWAEGIRWTQARSFSAWMASRLACKNPSNV